MAAQEYRKARREWAGKARTGAGAARDGQGRAWEGRRRRKVRPSCCVVAAEDSSAASLAPDEKRLNYRHCNIIISIIVAALPGGEK